MDFNDLDAREKSVIRALQRLASRWPERLRLISVGGSLNVAWSDGKGPDRLVAAVPHVPVGGEWQRERTADRWWYEFTARRDDATYAQQEPAVQLLLHPALGERHRLTFTERGWADFRDSAGRCGVALWDVQRTPVLPAEDVL